MSRAWGGVTSSYVLSLTDIHLPVIIGVNPEEKFEPQSILLSVSLAEFEGRPSLNLRALEKALHTVRTEPLSVPGSYKFLLL